MLPPERLVKRSHWNRWFTQWLVLSHFGCDTYLYRKQLKIKQNLYDLSVLKFDFKFFSKCLAKPIQWTSDGSRFFTLSFNSLKQYWVILISHNISKWRSIYLSNVLTVCFYIFMRNFTINLYDLTYFGICSCSYIKNSPLQIHRNLKLRSRTGVSQLIHQSTVDWKMDHTGCIDKKKSWWEKRAERRSVVDLYRL